MRRLLAATLAIVVIACSDTTGPGPITGSYTLRMVDGATLPAFLTEIRVTAGISAPFTERLWASNAFLFVHAEERDTLIVRLRSDITPEGGSTETRTSDHYVAIKLQGDKQCATDLTSWFDDTCPHPKPLNRRGDTLRVELAFPDSVSREYLFVREGR